MTAPTALVVNADSREGAIAVQALSDHEITEVRQPFADAKSWEAFAAELKGHGITFDVIVHCPLDGQGPEGVEAEILSAWLTAKFAIEVAAPGEPALLTLTREQRGASPIDADAAGNGIRFALRAAMLDASVRGVHLRSNRLAIASDTDEARLAEAIRALTDARASFVAGADLAFDAPLAAAPRLAESGASLAGRTVLVTGATSGIGRASAIEIGRQGGFVVVGGRKPDLAEETLALVREAGGEGMFVRLDVTDPQAWQTAAETIAATRGALHGLVNNAGEAKNLPIGQLSDEVPRFLVHLNYGGCRLGMDSLLDLLARDGGSVINVASVAGMRAGYGGSAYGASKAAMIGLSKSYAREVAGPRGVRVNAIQTGLIWSDSVIDSLGVEGAAKFRVMIEGKTPIGRVGTPDEVGRFVAYLLSDAAAGIHGQAIPVSGGLELVHP